MLIDKAYGLVGLAGLTGLLFVCLILVSSGVSQAGVLSPDHLAIQGRWVRSDAPYVIELRQSREGVQQATYFNRRPIHVEKTVVATQQGLLYVKMILQDTNYQGSTYILAYDRSRDMLQGTYLHGASGTTYRVEFSRQKSSRN